MCQIDHGASSKTQLLVPMCCPTVPREIFGHNRSKSLHFPSPADRLHVVIFRSIFIDSMFVLKTLNRLILLLKSWTLTSYFSNSSSSFVTSSQFSSFILYNCPISTGSDVTELNWVAFIIIFSTLNWKAKSKGDRWTVSTCAPSAWVSKVHNATHFQGAFTPVLVWYRKRERECMVSTTYTNQYQRSYPWVSK